MVIIEKLEMTGAEALIKALEKEGVDVVFGLPGGANLPMYNALVDANLRHILVRHEQSAASHGGWLCENKAESRSLLCYFWTRSD